MPPPPETRRIDARLPLVPSLLDRLTGPDPNSGNLAYSGSKDGTMVLRNLVDTVRRDLEDLLNTRRPENDIPPEFINLERSIFNYGIPDVVSLSRDSYGRPRELTEAIARAIEQFEPRLDRVEVTIDPSASPDTPAISYRIRARLKVEPSPSVAFVAEVDTRSGRAEIRPGERPATDAGRGGLGTPEPSPEDALEEDAGLELTE